MVLDHEDREGEGLVAGGFYVAFGEEGCAVRVEAAVFVEGVFFGRSEGLESDVWKGGSGIF